jgi:hypothetical protein
MPLQPDVTALAPAVLFPLHTPRRPRRHRPGPAKQGRFAVRAARHWQDAGGARGGGRVRRRLPRPQPLGHGQQVLWRLCEIRPVGGGAAWPRHGRWSGLCCGMSCRCGLAWPPSINMPPHMPHVAPPLPAPAQRRLHPGRPPLPLRAVLRRGGRAAGAPQREQGARGDAVRRYGLLRLAAVRSLGARAAQPACRAACLGSSPLLPPKHQTPHTAAGR